MKKCRVAIDPGASGGIVWNDVQDRLTAEPMPKTAWETAHLLKSIVKAAHIECLAVEAHLEQVGGFTGGAGSPGSAMFNFGEGYGFIQGVLAALDVPVIRWTPQRWQKTLGLGSRDHAPKLPTGAPAEDMRKRGAIEARLKAEWKNKLKAEAGRRNPEIKVTLGTADALLIHAASTSASAAPQREEDQPMEATA